MRQLFVIFCLLFSLWASAQYSYKREIESPYYNTTNTNTIRISKIVLTESQTVLDVEVSYTPDYWIKVAKGTYLRCNDKKYMITKSVGIELDKEFWMPKSGKASFQLFFPPLPQDAEEFDFIESDCADCWRIYGIDLTGNSKKRSPKLFVDDP